MVHLYLSTRRGLKTTTNICAKPQTFASAAATKANEDAATPKTAPSTSLRDVGSAFLPCCPSNPDPDPDPGMLAMCKPRCCGGVVTPPSRIDSRAPAVGGERASADAPPTRATLSIMPT